MNLPEDPTPKGLCNQLNSYEAMMKEIPTKTSPVLSLFSEHFQGFYRVDDWIRDKPMFLYLHKT